MKTLFSTIALAISFFCGTGVALQAERLLVEYEFSDIENATQAVSVDSALEASPFMMNSFFPPHREYFDGSRGTEAGEAAVTGRPDYYEFTLTGLSAIRSLDRLEVKITTRRRHAATRHRIDLEVIADRKERIGPLPFDFYTGEEVSGEPEVTNQKSITVGQSADFLGHSGDSGIIVLDLSEIEITDTMTFRVNFEDERGRTRTGVNRMSLFGH